MAKKALWGGRNEGEEEGSNRVWINSDHDPLAFPWKRDKDHHWFYTKTWELSFYPHSTPTGIGAIAILWMRYLKQGSLVLYSGWPVKGQTWGHLSPWWVVLAGQNKEPFVPEFWKNLLDVAEQNTVEASLLLHCPKGNTYHGERTLL